jgi:hypothetical protein
MPHPLSGSVSCAPPSGLGRCRVGSGSRPVSDRRPGFGGFLDRDLLVPWLLRHQWVVCALSAGPRWCWWGQISPPRLSFFLISVRQLGHFGFKGIVPEVEASLVISLKWTSYEYLLLLDSFRDFFNNSTKCLGVRHFLAKWFVPPHLWHVNDLPLPFPWPLALFFMFFPLVMISQCKIIMLFCLEEIMNKIWVSLVILGMVLMLQDPI